MPIYSYDCSRCMRLTEIVRSVAERDDPASCLSCGNKSIKRRIDVPQGLIGRNIPPPQMPIGVAGAAKPNVSFINCQVFNAHGGFLKMSGPLTARVENLTAYDTDRVFEMSDGARVDARNVFQTAPEVAPRRKPKKRRPKKSKRRR
jgi:putative FmdB family regulatory protein